MKFNFLVLSALITLLSGCVSAPKYYWGEYENIIYTQYQEPGKATPEYQIEKMRADLHAATGTDKPMPPGFYAHLGYQYLLAGKALQARNCFKAEKKAYPESAVLMDRFLSKVQ